MPPTVNNFVGQKSILRQVALGANVQTSWGTPFVLPAAFVYAPRFDIGNYVKITRSKESTYGQAGAPNSFANENWTTSQKTQLELSGFLTDWLAGWLLGLAMGKEVVTGAGPYNHTINFLDQGTIAQCTTIYGKDTNDLAYQLVDMGISQLTITANATGAMKYKATLLGTGVVIDGVLANMPTPGQPQLLYGNNLQISMGVAGGAVASIYPRVRTFELTIDTGMVQEFASGGGLYAGYLSTAMPKVKLKMVIAAKGADDIYGWKKNDTMLQLTANCTSAAAQLNITIPNFTLDENCALSDQNGISVWSLDLSETDILQIGATPLITCNVVNAVPSYLTAA